MRRNPKPLSINVLDRNIYENPTIQKFQNKGHNVAFRGTDFDAYDVTIGLTCWRIDPRLRLGMDSTDEESLERQLDMMEEGIRAVKYPKEKKDA